MKRISHGDSSPKAALNPLTEIMIFANRTFGFEPKEPSDFQHMFGKPSLDDCLPSTPETIAALKQLALTMTDLEPDNPTGGAVGVGDGPIPAAYTYFGQFLDHDITFDTGSASIETLSKPDLLPLQSFEALKNIRSATLDLDSLYAVPPEGRDGDRLRVGEVVRLNGSPPFTARPAGKSDFNDLPRQGRSDNKDEDRAAIIGDPRNDENTILSQLHVAFIKAHNALIDEGLDFEAARRAMILRYQAIVLHDFMPKICDPEVAEQVLAGGAGFWRPDELFMPVEFSVAGYRFGHSMIRKLYDFNLNFTDERAASFVELFSFTALSGNIGQVVAPETPQNPGGGFDTLPDNWIIEWERFLPLGPQPPQMARLIDPRLTDELFKLRDTFGQPEGENEPEGSPSRQLAPMLAMRNLMRGYLFGLPTGQTMAERFNLAPLSGQALLDALPTDAMKDAAAPFAEATPLWFYVLAEAGDPNGAQGRHLGKLGSRIVAETLWTLVKNSPTSILDGEDHTDVADFTLSDLIRLAARQDAIAGG